MFGTWEWVTMDEIFRQTESLPENTDFVFVKIYQWLHHPTLGEVT